MRSTPERVRFIASVAFCCATCEGWSSRLDERTRQQVRCHPDGPRAGSAGAAPLLRSSCGCRCDRQGKRLRRRPPTVGPPTRPASVGFAGFYLAALRDNPRGRLEPACPSSPRNCYSNCDSCRSVLVACGCSSCTSGAG